jgi:ABC-type transport system involved in multi-copper enzyme maturation permease subunit
MNLALTSFASAVRAFFGREIRTVFRNRFFHVFAVLALTGGWSAVALGPSPGSIPFILLQLTLYLVPLFAVLIAISSAHGELEEYPFLFSQPISRFALVLGKWVALGCACAVILLLTYLPALLTSPSVGKLLLLGGQSLCLSGIFVGLGLAVGFSTSDRGRGLIYALVIWLLLLVGYDLLAWLAAQFPVAQKFPGVWFSALVLNPLDAVRIATLFSLEEIPFNVPGENAVVLFWCAHLGKWVVIVSGFGWARRCAGAGWRWSGSRCKADGKWQMADGRWQMADGRWQMANGRWQMANGKWQTEGRRLEIADWRFQITNRKSQIAVRKSEIANRKSEIGNRKS